MPKNTDVYERITQNVVALIEKGELLPWQRPWKATDWARSMSTKRTYNGGNRWYLTALAQANGWSPWFGTYKQIEALGGQVRRGEKSSLAYFWNIKEVLDKDTGLPKKVPMLRTYNVFSASQADGLPEKFYDKPTDSDVVLDVTADEVFKHYTESQSIKVNYGGSQAFYSPGSDSITLPHAETFVSGDHFHATAFHEAGHSTGAKSRLGRPGVVDFDAFGSHQYSREELVAELSSALVLGTLGLDKPNLVEHQAAYLKGWLSALQGDPQAIVWAAGRAEKAADLILGSITPNEEEEEGEGE